MANQDTPFGLKPVRNRSGDIRINKYFHKIKNKN